MELPALAIQQPDFARTLSAVAQIKGANLQNKLIEAQLARQQKTDALAGNALDETGQVNQSAITEWMRLDPKGASGFLDAINKMDTTKIEQERRRTEPMVKGLMYVLNQPPEAQPMAYAQMIGQLKASGHQFQQEPPPWNPQMAEMEVLKGLSIAEAQTRNEAQRAGPQLQEIYDPKSPTGTRLVPRAEAAGQPGKPSSGLKMTVGPDGTVELTQGRLGAGGDSALSKTTNTKIEQKVIDEADILSNLQEMQNAFEPRFLQYQTQLGEAWKGVQEKAGFELTPEQKEASKEFNTFKSSTIENASKVINKLSGAAVSEAEYKRLSGFLPTMEDSPTEFKSKMDRLMRSSRLAISRSIYFKNNGIPATEEQFKKVPLANMDALIQRRGNELLAEIKKATPDIDDATARQQVRASLKEEFGI